MTIQDFASIAEIVSTFAILVTLIYLARETKQNTAALHASIRQASLEAELSIIDKQLEFPHLRPAMLSGNLGGLSNDQIEQTKTVVIALFRVRETNWLQHKAGVMDDETWQLYRRSLVIFINMAPVIKQEWERANRTGFYHPGFLEEINAFHAQNSALGIGSGAQE